jgi:hypothetical protein
MYTCCMSLLLMHEKPISAFQPHRKKRILPFHFHYTLFFAIIGLWTIYENEMRTRCTIYVACQLLPFQFNVSSTREANYENWKIYVFAWTMYPSLYASCSAESFIHYPNDGKKWSKIHKNKLNKKKRILHKNNFYITIFNVLLFNVNIEFTSNSQLLFFS